MTLGSMGNVELFDAGEKGRALRATRELQAGDVVFSEASYAAVVFDSLSTQVCHNCFRRQSNLHRCAQCKFAHYCDRTCQTACWDEHKQECAAIKKLEKAPKENVRLAARVLWRMQRHTGIASDGQLTAVDQLQEHVSQLSADALTELQDDVHSFRAYWTSRRSQHSEEYISSIFGIISCNGFTLSDQRGLQAVGVGLFPNLCMVNHDCWPNCTVILNHGDQSALDSALHSKRRIELRALEGIEAGRELTVSYVDFLNLSAERQRILKKQYHFDCSCHSCTTHSKDDLMMAAKETGDKKPSAELVKEVTDFSLESLAKIGECRSEGNYHKVVQLCLESLEKMEPVLADTHLYLLKTLSIASEVLSFLQNFSEAAALARRMVEGYTKLYHPNNAQLGMATMRAGVTHWHAGCIEVGHGMICEAYAILIITHSPNHPISKDLEAMRVQTELELHMFKQDEHAYHSLRDAALKDKLVGPALKDKQVGLALKDKPVDVAGAPSADEEIKALSRKQ